jgi:hypothetical protein
LDLGDESSLMCDRALAFCDVAPSHCQVFKDCRPIHSSSRSRLVKNRRQLAAFALEDADLLTIQRIEGADLERCVLATAWAASPKIIVAFLRTDALGGWHLRYRVKGGSAGASLCHR